MIHAEFHSENQSFEEDYASALRPRVEGRAHRRFSHFHEW